MFCIDLIFANDLVAYLKLSRSIILYTIRHASAHCICSTGKSLSLSCEISTISTSIRPLSSDIVWRYNRSVFDRYSPINRLVRYRTVNAICKRKKKVKIHVFSYIVTFYCFVYIFVFAYFLFFFLFCCGNVIRIVYK